MTWADDQRMASREEIFRPWQLSFYIIKVSVKVSKSLNVGFVFFHRYYLSKTPFLQVVHNPVSCFKSGHIWFLLEKTWRSGLCVHGVLICWENVGTCLPNEERMLPEAMNHVGLRSNPPPWTSLEKTSIHASCICMNLWEIEKTKRRQTFNNC